MRNAIYPVRYAHPTFIQRRALCCLSVAYLETWLCIGDPLFISSSRTERKHVNRCDHVISTEPLVILQGSTGVQPSVRSADVRPMVGRPTGAHRTDPMVSASGYSQIAAVLFHLPIKGFRFAPSSWATCVCYLWRRARTCSLSGAADA